MPHTPHRRLVATVVDTLHLNPQSKIMIPQPSMPATTIYQPLQSPERPGVSSKAKLSMLYGGLAIFRRLTTP